MYSSHKYDNHANNEHYLVDYNGRKVCVCQLCTCGKHKICPKNYGKQTFQTSYSRQFKQFQPMQQIDSRPPYRYEERHYTPDAMMTNYQENYQKQVQFPTNQSMTEEMMTNSRLSEVAKTILAPPVKFVGVTSYNQQYQPYQVTKNQQDYENPQQTDILSPYKSQMYKKPEVKFQGISSYKSTYLPPPEIKRKIQPSSYKKPDAPFYGSSSYKEQYKPIEIVPQKQVINNSYMRPQNSRVRFEGKSAYKEHYLPYEISQQNINDYLVNQKISCRLDEIAIPNIKFKSQYE